MKLLQLDKISDESIESLIDSFNNLPETDHADGKYRLRRYSVIELRTTFLKNNPKYNKPAFIERMV